MASQSSFAMGWDSSTVMILVLFILLVIVLLMV